MNTYKWLHKREFWEHKGGFFWAPAVVGAIMTLFLAASMLIGLSVGHKHGFSINGEQVTNLSRVVSVEDKAKIVDAISQGYMGTAMPLFMVMAFVVFFFCLGTLFDERKDRSVLFWKSLPVSDNETVVSKVAMALVGAPLLTLAFAVATSLLALFIILVGASISGLSLWGAVLASPAVYLAPFAVLSLIPVYALWALPTVGWLMMVSAWAKTKVFLWAVGVPVLAGVLISWFNAMFDFNWNVQWFWHHVIGRGLLSVVPGSWFGFVDPAGGMQVHEGGMHFGVLVVQSWKTLASANAWIGAVIGVAMLYAAARLRRWRDEG
jgi:ABC-2 type transport system permease protein